MTGDRQRKGLAAVLEFMFVLPGTEAKLEM
jgi:hypothetical protein